MQELLEAAARRLGRRDERDDLGLDVGELLAPAVRLQTIETRAAPRAPAQAETLPPPGAGLLAAASSR